MPEDIVAIARASYEAYARKDRKAIEALIADDFHFTSPLDNRLDRATYFARCWPNSERLAVKFIHLVRDGDRVFVTYEGHTKGGGAFRNTEIVTVRGGRIVEAEVYFGWELPHKSKIVSDRSTPLRSWNVNLALQHIGIEQDSRFGRHGSIEAR